MHDNGRQTFMLFSAANPLPAAFIIEPDGTESLVDYHVEEDTMVLHRVVAARDPASRCARRGHHQPIARPCRSSRRRQGRRAARCSGRYANREAGVDVRAEAGSTGGRGRARRAGRAQARRGPGPEADPRRDFERGGVADPFRDRQQEQLLRAVRSAGAGQDRCAERQPPAVSAGGEGATGARAAAGRTVVCRMPGRACAFRSD